MYHKIIRVDNLMYKGCEPHWKCTICGECVPFHCYTRQEFAQMECKASYLKRKERNDKDEIKEIKPITWIEIDNRNFKCPYCNSIWDCFENEISRFNCCPNCGRRLV